MLCWSTICAQGTAGVQPAEVAIIHMHKYTRHVFEKLTEIHIIALSRNTGRFPPHRSLWVVGFIQWAWSEGAVASSLKGPHPDVLRRVALHRRREVTYKDHIIKDLVDPPSLCSHKRLTLSLQFTYTSCNVATPQTRLLPHTPHITGALTKASARSALKISSESVLRTLKVVVGGLSEMRSGPVCC